MKIFDYYQDITNHSEILAKSWREGDSADFKIEQLVNVEQMYFYNEEETLEVCTENDTFTYGKGVIVEFGTYQNGEWCAEPYEELELPCRDHTYYLLKNVDKPDEPNLNSVWGRVDACVWDEDGEIKKIDLHEFVDKQLIVVDDGYVYWEELVSVFPEPAISNEAKEKIESRLEEVTLQNKSNSRFKGDTYELLKYTTLLMSKEKLDEKNRIYPEY